MINKKVLTYRWHVGHQYELWKLPFEFTLLHGKTDMTSKWDYTSRPLHSNVKFKEISENEDLSGYDLAILHFDEFVLRAKEYPHVLASDWGEQFKYIMDNYNGPKIAICHGVPIYKGTYDLNYDKSDLGEIIEEYRKELVDYLDETLVICNSHQAQEEWGFKNSKVIWHGFDPLLYPPTNYKGGVITICGGMYQRHHYRGLSLYKEVMENIKWNADFLGSKNDDFPNKVSKKSLDESLFTTENDWARFNYSTYVNFISNYSIFFNPTLKSPMPRTRGEAMMSGLVIITPDNHDASMFIENGYNGFVSDDPEEISYIIEELNENVKLRSKIGKRGRETAIECFHINKYLNEWMNVISEFTEIDSKFKRYDINSPTVNSNEKETSIKKIKGIIYISGNDGGANRYRVSNAIESLETEESVNILNIPFMEINEENVKKYFIKDAFNVVICHRVTFGGRLELLIEEAQQKNMLLIYDNDDLIHEEEYAKQLEDIGKKSFEDGLKDVENYVNTIKLFDHITCSTNTLKSSFRKLGIENIKILENTFSKKLLTMSNAAYKDNKIKKEHRNKVIIGYASGSATHEKDFMIAVPALRKILSEFSNVNIHLIGAIEMPPELEEFSDQIILKPFVHWLGLPQVLANLDISLAPLQNNDFCNAKSAIKFIEAALVRVPTIASPTEPFKKAIKNHDTGFVASVPEEWYKYLKLLIENPSKRTEIGKNAFKDVEINYNSEVKREKIIEILDNWL